MIDTDESSVSSEMDLYTLTLLHHNLVLLACARL